MDDTPIDLQSLNNTTFDSRNKKTPRLLRGENIFKTGRKFSFHLDHGTRKPLLIKSDSKKKSNSMNKKSKRRVISDVNFLMEGKYLSSIREPAPSIRSKKKHSTKRMTVLRESISFKKSKLRKK